MSVPRPTHDRSPAADVVARVLVSGIALYQVLLSPVLPASCRFVPTCSDYAREAINRHGPARGFWLAVKRIGRCHPFGGHGFDPVPDAQHAAGERPPSPMRRNGKTYNPGGCA